MHNVRLQTHWVDLLHQAFAVVDASVSQAIANAHSTPACAKGCSFCCFQKIPLTILEVLGIKEYLRSENPPRVKELPASPPGKNEGLTPCPFLLDGVCSIYPVRPIACRRYIVLSRPCAWGEFATETRPDDVLLPARKALNRALLLTRPFYETYGVCPPDEDGTTPLFSIFCKEIHTIDWWGNT